MPDAEGQPLLHIAILVVAVLSLFWQILCARLRRENNDLLSHPAFWLGSVAWIIFGFLLRDGSLWPSLTGVVRWILPIIGLIVHSLVEWVAMEVPRIITEQTAEKRTGNGKGTENGNGDSRLEGDLDVADTALLHSLLSLLNRRAINIMVPVAEVPCLTEDAQLDQVLQLLASEGTYRIPILDRSKSYIRGIIDGRNLVPDQLKHDGGDAVALAGDLCEPIQTIHTRKSSKDALEILRSDSKGVIAVVDIRDRCVGFLAWQPIFRQLLDRPYEGGLQ